MLDVSKSCSLVMDPIRSTSGRFRPSLSPDHVTLFKLAATTNTRRSFGYLSDINENDAIRCSCNILRPTLSRVASCHNFHKLAAAQQLSLLQSIHKRPSNVVFLQLPPLSFCPPHRGTTSDFCLYDILGIPCQWSFQHNCPTTICHFYFHHGHTRNLA